MAAWLSEQEAPAGFTLDRDCELKQPDSEKATVRYARHTLDIAEVGRAHQGRASCPRSWAMTWASRVSFVLSETMALKRIKLLDVVLESGDADRARGTDDDGFDADVALATGELGRLIPELITALGGPHAAPATAADSKAPAVAAATGDDGTAPWDDGPA
jgi:recombination associated protein RdgC